MANVKTVTIGFQNGEIECSPASVKLSKTGGDQIKWQCPQGYAFAIDLGFDTPLFDEQYRWKRGQVEKVHDIHNDAKKGRHKYIIALHDGNDIYIEDPEIIIKR